MQSKERLRTNKISRLPDDLLLYLSLLIDMNSVLSVKTVSRHSNNRISNLMKKEDFWIKMSEFYFSSKPENASISKQTSCKDLYLLHLIPIKILEAHLKNSPYYQSYKPAFGFFSSGHYYIHPTTRVKFSLEEIRSFIINDDAINLFSKVSRLSQTLFSIENMNSNSTNINNVLLSLEQSFILTNFENFKIGDLSFIGFLPCIISFRAIQCFDLFINIFFKFFIRYPEIKGLEKYQLGTVSKMVLNSKDDYFIQRFIFWMIKFSEKDSALCEELCIIAKRYKADWVRLAFEQLSSSEKDLILACWRNTDSYHTLRDILNLEKEENQSIPDEKEHYQLVQPQPNPEQEEQRYQLINTLKSAITLLENNTLELDQLLPIQDKAQSQFASLINLIADQQSTVKLGNFL